MTCEELIAEYERITGHPRTLLTPGEFLMFRKEAAEEEGYAAGISRDAETCDGSPGTVQAVKTTRMENGTGKPQMQATVKTAENNIRKSFPYSSGESPDISAGNTKRDMLSVLRSVPG